LKYRFNRINFGRRPFSHGLELLYHITYINLGLAIKPTFASYIVPNQCTVYNTIIPYIISHIDRPIVSLSLSRTSNHTLTSRTYPSLRLLFIRLIFLKPIFHHPPPPTLSIVPNNDDFPSFNDRDDITHNRLTSPGNTT
jgi:hypothetical protein